jgi:hypothetical protein
VADYPDIAEALDLAAGSRISHDILKQRTASPNDVAVTRKTILLFLGELDPSLTVGELREVLDQ